MACSKCGARTRSVNPLLNKTATKPLALNANFKSSDFVLGYLISDLNPVIGVKTGINYGDRKNGEQFYVNKNDLDGVNFSLMLPTSILSEFSVKPPSEVSVQSEEVEVVAVSKSKKSKKNDSEA